jgi:hypothetical protein
VTVCLGGCGDPEQAEREVGVVVPFDAQDVAPAVSSTVAGEATSLGLDLIRFPTPSDDPAAARLASRGPEAAQVDESTLYVDRSTPAALLDGTLRALQLEDVAALARLSRPAREHPALDEDDAARAERRFLGPATRSYWTRIASAVRSGAFEVVDLEDDQATVRVDVGGSAGVYVVQLRKVEDGWYLAG